jgi:hypothetical protein
LVSAAFQMEMQEIQKEVAISLSFFLFFSFSLPFSSCFLILLSFSHLFFFQVDMRMDCSICQILGAVSTSLVQRLTFLAHFGCVQVMDQYYAAGISLFSLFL